MFFKITGGRRKGEDKIDNPQTKIKSEIKKKLFIVLLQVLVAAHRIFGLCCGI